MACMNGQVGMGDGERRWGGGWGGAVRVLMEDGGRRWGEGWGGTN